MRQEWAQVTCTGKDELLSSGHRKWHYFECSRRRLDLWFPVHRKFHPLDGSRNMRDHIPFDFLPPHPFRAAASPVYFKCFICAVLFTKLSSEQIFWFYMCKIIWAHGWKCILMCYMKVNLHQSLLAQTSYDECKGEKQKMHKIINKHKDVFSTHAYVSPSKFTTLCCTRNTLFHRTGLTLDQPHACIHVQQPIFKKNHYMVQNPITCFKYQYCSM